jgi:hypothetical protein
VAVEVRLSLPSDVWQRIREVRSQVAEAFRDLPFEVRTAAQMVTGELVENAVKFGEPVASCPDVRVRAAVEQGRVVVEVSNGVASRASIEHLLLMIQKISKSESRELLYIARLEEMLRSPATRGGLGLYRIGFEGNFDLTCHLDGEILTVRAVRVFQ